MENHTSSDPMPSKTAPSPRVVLGERVFKAQGWARKDSIFIGNERIGVIELTDKARSGETVSLLTGARHPGRALTWCVGESQRALALAGRCRAA